MGTASALRAIGRNAQVFALVTVGCYVLLLVPMVMATHLKLSPFILAGDAFVSRDGLLEPIAIVPDSHGYDGQFFYRFALDPFSLKRTSDGITLDQPAKRMQRIVYPLLARLASLGVPGAISAGLVIVNLLGLGVIAAGAAWLAQRHALAWWYPFATLLWPGFQVALTHDTAEITASAFMLTGLACYLSDRLFCYCLLGAAAALTRETTVPFLLGPLIYESYRAVATAPHLRRLIRVVPCVLTFVPFLIWWGTVGALWHEPPQSLSSNSDIGWPLAGVSNVLLDTLSGRWTAQPYLGNRVLAGLTTSGAIVFCIAIARRIPRLLRLEALPAVAIGWLLTAALMSLLTADGPLVDQLSFSRAFTECWVIGCFLLAYAPNNRIVGRPFMFSAALLAYAYLALYKWSFILLLTAQI
jgi:hypothetical protein